MIIPEQIDYDRLHRNIKTLTDGRSAQRSRGEGYTFAYLILMLGEIETGDPDNTYMYIGENFNYTKDVCGEFFRLIGKTYGPSLIQGQSPTSMRLMLPCGQRFHFIPITHVGNPCTLR